MGVARFQELHAWQLADEVKKRVYALIENSKAAGDRRFCDQIIASAASAPANIAEGFGYYRHREFARQTRIARASLLETQNHLLDGADRRFWSPEEARALAALADRAIGACVRLVAHLERTEAPGAPTRPPRRRAARRD
jgi:four helix bundle protein